MAIRSQNKRIVVNWNNIKGFQIIEDIPAGSSCRIIAVDSDIPLIFAVYDSRDKAEAALRELFDNIRNNEPFYQFPENYEI